MNVTLFTDASRCHISGISAWACWAVSSRSRVEHGGPFRDKTISSTDAEMQAVANGLVVALNAGVLEPGDRVVIATDALSVIHRFHPPAFKNSKSGRRSARLYAKSKPSAAEQAIRDFIAEHRLTFEFRHVKGHVAGGNGRNYVNRLLDGVEHNAMPEVTR